MRLTAGHNNLSIHFLDCGRSYTPQPPT